jgi:hypothetical protein
MQRALVQVGIVAHTEHGVAKRALRHTVRARLTRSLRDRLFVTTCARGFEFGLAL